VFHNEIAGSRFAIRLACDLALAHGGRVACPERG
jgi:hypothetical protein